MHDFPVEYFKTYFELEGTLDELPASYSIITAFATTGQKWTDKENQDADSCLKSELEDAGLDNWRITGYSPATGHAEPGWATTLSVNEACELGRRYHQHAVFIVQDGMLSVMLCDGGKQKTVGEISKRLHTATEARIAYPEDGLESKRIEEP